MKIVISMGNGWSSNYLVLDAQHAPLAAGLLANGALYTSDGQTGDGAHYKLDKQSSLSITYTNDAQFEELPAAVYEARKQAEEASSARWNEKRPVEREAPRRRAAEAARYRAGPAGDAAAGRHVHGRGGCRAGELGRRRGGVT